MKHSAPRILGLFMIAELILFWYIHMCVCVCILPWVLCEWPWHENSHPIFLPTLVISPLTSLQHDLDFWPLYARRVGNGRRRCRCVRTKRLVLSAYVCHPQTPSTSVSHFAAPWQEVNCCPVFVNCALPVADLSKIHLTHSYALSWWCRVTHTFVMNNAL